MRSARLRRSWRASQRPRRKLKSSETRGAGPTASSRGDDEEEAEDVEYEEKEVDGVKYAFADDFLYSLSTGDCVGFLNPETGKIEAVEDDEE